VKIKGADLIQFMADWPLPDGVCIEEAPFDEGGDPVVLRWVDGVDEYDTAPAVDPTAMYDVKWGSFEWQGSGMPPAGIEWDIPRHLHKWLKARTVTSFAVTVPNEDADAFRALCLERGWKVG